MAWLPAVHRAPHPVFACEHGTSAETKAGNRQSPAWRTGATAPRWGGSGARGTCPRVLLRCRSRSIGASVSSKRNYPFTPLRRARAAWAETSSTSSRLRASAVGTVPSERGALDRRSGGKAVTIDRRSRGSTACILPRVWPTGDPGRRNTRSRSSKEATGRPAARPRTSCDGRHPGSPPFASSSRKAQKKRSSVPPIRIVRPAMAAISVRGTTGMSEVRLAKGRRG